MESIRIDDSPSYYAVIPAEVRYDKNLKDKAKLLYGEISALCNKNGICWASNSYFANLYGVSNTTISTLIKNLVDRGYIETEIIYREGTKEILNRYLKIFKDPYLKNFKYPMQKNLKDNNTSINNTSINNNPYNPPKEFETFWKAYPRHDNKQKTIKWFEKNKPSEGLLKIMLDKIELLKKTKQWQNKQFIPMPTTWLNGKRWEDEVLESDLTKEEEIPISEDELLKLAQKEIEEEKRNGTW